jgi:hypothetical protein
MNKPNNCRNKNLWKVKLRLKIKVFCGIYVGERSSKDNLVKRCWKGCLTCSFCNRNESIKHLFFYCYMAKSIWRIIYFALKIDMPVSVNHTIRSWGSNRGPGHKKILLSGVSALFWSIWLSQNKVAFNHKPISLIVQAIFRGTHWFRF